MTTNDLTLLRDAGYRERAFAKALLVSNGQADAWPDALEQWRFDARRDEVVDLDGERTKVRWEGSRSREILAEHGFDDSGCDPNGPKGPTVGDLSDAKARALSLIRKGLEPFRGKANDPEAQERARAMIEGYLRDLVKEEPLFRPADLEVKADPDRPGVFHFKLPIYDLPMSAEIPPTDEEVEYLDDIAAARLAAPEGTEEETLLARAHALACGRLRVDAEKHLTEATALGKVEVSPEPPFLVNLVGALSASLEGNHDEWLGVEPWREWGGDDEAPGFFAELAVRACSEAARGYVFADRGDDVAHLAQAVVGVLILEGVEHEQIAELTVIDRCRMALDVARGG